MVNEKTSKLIRKAARGLADEFAHMRFQGTAPNPEWVAARTSQIESTLRGQWKRTPRPERGRLRRHLVSCAAKGSAR